METHHHEHHAAQHPGKDNQTILAVLAYLGPLVIIPYLMARQLPFVKFHIKQGLVLIVIEIILWALMPLFWPFGFIFRIIDLIVFALAIVGIINAIQHKEKELPVVGDWARNFRI